MTSEFHPVGHLGGLAEICEDVAFLPAFANVTATRTATAWCWSIPAASFAAQAIHDELRRWTDQRLNTAIYSHGHIDHVFGVGAWEAESPSTAGPPRSSSRTRRCRGDLTGTDDATATTRSLTSASSACRGLRWPTEYRYPDRTYRDELTVTAGGTTFALRHEKGETDDHTVTWLADRRVLCCGDLFIWASPNAGNPQKVQRYPLEWAQALRRMLALQPEYLLPGHGLPVVGRRPGGACPDRHCRAAGVTGQPDA